jgi:hypothetical protein
MATTRKPAAPKAAPKTEPKAPTKTEKLIQDISKERVKTTLMAEDLTKALREDGLMSEEYAIRLRPLFMDFDIVNASFFEGQELTFQKVIGPVEKTLEKVREL